MLTPLKLVLLFVSALIAGAINSVAGGGTLLTFPALLSVGIGSVSANATSTVALVPGSLSAFWGYRGVMEGSRRQLLWLGIPSVIGGFVGAFLVVHVGDALFSRLVPWLIFAATGLFMAQEPIRRWMAQRKSATEEDTEEPDKRRLAGVVLFQFLVAVYGGFFGAGIGIAMLAALGILGLSSIHRMNGLKNFAAVCINGVGALTFAFAHKVHWLVAGLMAVGAIIGGYSGAGIAQKIGQKNVRRLVILIGLCIGVRMLFQQFYKPGG